MAERTFSWGTPPVDEQTSTALGTVAGRYVLVGPIAKGGFGTVWDATDRVTGRQVALKLVPLATDRDLQWARREITALRWARLPGVVRLLDEGIDDARWFIAMERVDGKRFPGIPTPCSWPQLAPVVLALLDVLARLHFSGLVHRDLKPSNVLVDANGRPKVVDLGISGGRQGTPAPQGSFVGTPRYASPEQCRRETVGPRSDLYSLALMIVEALTGAVPLAADNARKTLRRRRTESAPDLTDALGHLGPDVVAVLQSMLASDPEGRPESALEVLQQLGGQVPAPLGPSNQPPGQRATWRALRRHFLGLERFHHVRTDAARELYRRTGGHPDRVHRELAAWLRAGLGHWEGDAVRIDRRALAELADGIRLDPGVPAALADPDEQRLLEWTRFAFPSAPQRVLRDVSGLGDRFDATLARLVARGELWRGPGGSWFAGAPIHPAPGWSAAQRRRAAAALARRHDGWRLGRLVAAGADRAEVLDEAVRSSSRLLAQGHHPRARSIARRALAMAPTGGRSQQQLLDVLTASALAENTAEACNEALYDVERQTDVSGPGRVHLLRALRSLHTGEIERARECLEQCPHYESGPMVRRFQAVGLACARVSGPQEAERYLDGLPERANTTAVDWAYRQSWRGTLYYSQGRYAEAAERCLDAAASLTGIGRIAALVNAAGAEIERGRHRQAAHIAGRAARVARERRAPRLEAMASWIQRAAGYRGGWIEAAAPRLVEAGFSVTPYIGALFALQEAAIAHRAARSDLARELAEQAAAGFREAGHSRQADLADALCVANGGEADTDGLVRRALRGERPEFDVQVLGLLEAPVDPTDLQARIPAARRCMRLDVMSVDECVRVCEGKLRARRPSSQVPPEMLR